MQEMSLALNDEFCICGCGTELVLADGGMCVHFVFGCITEHKVVQTLKRIFKNIIKITIIICTYAGKVG